MILKTDRLIIREFTAEDLNALASLLGNEQVMEFSIGGPLSWQQTKEYLEQRILPHYAHHGFGLWAVVYEGQVIGYAGLITQQIDGEKLIELGYRLLPEYWGKGLASEAAGAIAQYAFDQLNLEQIISIVEEKNVRSVSVAKRLGMHHWKDADFHGKIAQIYCLHRVSVEHFDPIWEKVFEAERRQLEKIFEGHPIEFIHIGSTSIGGCSAKPVIDILGITTDILEIDAFNQKMVELGYRPRGEYGMKQRRFFQRKAAPKVHLHIFERTDPEVGRHLRFCNYLRAHPEKVKEYSELKEELAKRFPHDIAGYILGKEKWIKQTDLQAAWAASTLSIPEQPKRTNWTQSEILKAMEVNMHLQMTYFAKYIPTMEIVFEPDVTVVRSEVPDDTFNYVLSARFTEKNGKERIAHVQSLYQDRPYSWWVGESDTPSNLSELLQIQGFEFKEKNVGMYLDLSHFQPILTSSLQFHRVQSPEQMQDFAKVVVDVSEMTEIYDLVYAHLPPVLYSGSSPMELYVGYLDGAPVITGMLIAHAHVAGIYYIMTLPTQRKKGFGTAMMNLLLDRAKARGYCIATLQASSEGYHLYERLGFQRCCEFLEYTQKKQVRY